MEKKSNIKLKKIRLTKNNLIRVVSSENPQSKNIKIIKSNTQKKIHRPTSALANQNMNNFAHLFKNNQNTNIDILWTLNLRQSENNTNLKKEKLKNNIELLKEPSFYQEDLEKYIKKKIKKSKSTFEVSLPTLSQYNHLYKKKLSDSHGTILNNKDLLYYELTLRTTNFKEKKNNHNDKEVIKKKKWNNSFYKEKSKDLITINYNNDKISEKLKNSWLDEKLVNRPYKIIFKKIKYDDNSHIIKKIYVKDKEKAFNTLGENYSYRPYNDKYSEKNYNNIENLLNNNNKSQQNVWFQLSLRNNNKKINHKIIKN